MRTVDATSLDEPLLAHVRNDFIPLRPDQTVEEALNFLRSQNLGERLIYFYVTDDRGRLLGVMPTRRLLASDTSRRIEAVMVAPVASLPSSATVREACEAFLHHRYLALPVVDEAGRLLGVADVGVFTDELADVVHRQAVDDTFQLLGIHVAAGVTSWASFKDRLPWLAFNVAGGLLAAVLASVYEELLDAAVILALFIPVVLALAESVSMQSVTLTLQRLHGRTVQWRELWWALRREFVTAVLLGGACGAAVGLAAWLWKGEGAVAATIGLVISVSMVSACALGVILPTSLRAFRRDPRVAAGPVVLACADLLTLLLYFNVAGWLL